MGSGRPLPLRVIPGRARLAHPLAWWIWAGALAAAISRLANPLLLLLAIGVVVVVVLNRRDPSAPGSLSVIGIIGLAAVVMRLVVSVVFGSGRYGRTVLVDAPVVPLPDWLGGIRLGGPVTAEGLATAGVEGLRLAAILIVLAAANLLASPRRLLRYLPASLDDIGTTMVIGLAYAPALADDAARVRRARRLRGHGGRGIREVAATLPVVLDGALERALALAASMDTRGYGRRRAGTASRRSGIALLVGSFGALAGVYGLFDATTPTAVALALALGGTLVASLAGVYRARSDRRTRYRRDPWGLPETLTALSGLLTAAAAVAAGLSSSPVTRMETLPVQGLALPLLALPVLAVAAAPAWVTPAPPLHRRRREVGDARATAVEPGVPPRTRPAARTTQVPVVSS